MKWLCEDIEEALGARDGSRRFHGVVDLPSIERKRNASSRVDVNVGIDIIWPVDFRWIVMRSIVVTGSVSNSSIGCRRNKKAFCSYVQDSRCAKFSNAAKTVRIAPIKTSRGTFSLKKFLKFEF